MFEPPDPLKRGGALRREPSSSASPTRQGRTAPARSVTAETEEYGPPEPYEQDELEVPSDLPAESSPSASDTVLLHLWSRLHRGRQLTSLVVVPAHPGGSGMAAARAIIEVGRLQRSAPMRLIDAEGLRLGGAAQVIREMNASVARGAMVVVVVDSVLANPVGLEVAMAARHALLSVTLGTTDLASARRTLEMVGRERFVGSVTLRKEGP